MKRRDLRLVSVLQAPRLRPFCDSHTESTVMASQLASNTRATSLAYSALVDPNDETIETEITEDMIELALEAVEHEQVWPFCGAVPVKARAPRRSADVIRFPGC